MTVSMRLPYKIYRDPIPVAPPRRPSIIPFAEMKVGDVTTYVPTAPGSSHTLAVSAHQRAAQNYKDRRFLVCISGDVVEIWRVK